MEYTIKINRVPPGLNSLMRMHWAEREKLLQEWRELVRLEMLSQGISTDILVNSPCKRTIKIEIYKKRLMDIDNLYGGVVKVILDAIKCKKDKMGNIIPNLIYDDSSKFTKVSIKQKKSDEEFVIIKIKV